jgi:hypothetical protein
MRILALGEMRNKKGKAPDPAVGGFLASNGSTA